MANEIFPNNIIFATFLTFQYNIEVIMAYNS